MAIKLIMKYELSNTYPYNIPGVKQFDIETWLEAYFMPLTGVQYREIYNTVLTAYIGAFCSSDSTYWNGAANFKMIKQVTQILFAKLRILKLRELGYQNVLGETCQDLHKAEQTIHGTEVSVDNLNRLPFTERARQTIKSKMAFFQANHNPGKYNLGLGSSAKEIRHFEHATNSQTIRIYPSAFIPRIGSSTKPTYTLQTEQFISELQDKFAFIDTPMSQNLSGQINVHMTHSHIAIEHFYKTIKKATKSHFLATRLNNYLHRLFIAACHLAEVQTIGFPHGNTFATCYDTIHIESDGLSIVSHLQASTKGQAKLLSDLAINHGENFRLAQVAPPQESLYKDLYTQLKKEPHPQKIETVMLIGFPTTDVFYPSFPAHHALSQFHLEISLMKLLRKKGYRILYKTHPASIVDIKGVFDKYADEIVLEPFEAIYQKADCILFPHSRTSTFGFALLTSKPIVLINTENTMWHPDVIADLKKRCRIVNAKTDERDRICFDDKTFIDAIDEAFNHQDYRIVENFAL